ncbi:MAG: hypothetical protein ACREMW_01375 [Gemmatimonadales bacterium]
MLTGLIVACGGEKSPSRPTEDAAAAATTTELGKEAGPVVTHPTPTDPSRTAALIAAVMLRFAQQDSKGVITDASGGTTYLILPDGPRFRDGDLIDWLERAPKPLFAVPAYIRGMIAAWPAVAGSQIRHDLANQQNVIAEFQATHHLSETTVIMLKTGTETVSFPLSHLKVWAANYVASVGWNVRPPQDGAPTRLMLIIPGGRRSPE